MCSYVYALVQSRKHTRFETLEAPSSASVQCQPLQPQGEAPASSPARDGQAEHLAPSFSPYSH